jgi:sugar phosphate isomerase/epimerase
VFSLKLGYSTNALVRYSLFEAVDRIAGLGFGGIEIMGDRPHLYPPDWGQDELVRLRDRISSSGLHINNINSFTLFAVGDTYLPSWIEEDPARREIRIRHTRDSIRLASELGCRNISIPPGGPLNGMSRQKAAELFRKGLDRTVPLAEELGVKLLIEPEPDLFLENSSGFREFIRDIRSPFIGLNFDIGHFFCAGEDPAGAFEDLLPWIGHVHLEDIAADRRHYHLIPGRGAIDFEKVLTVIRKCGYCGDISLELYTYPDKPIEAGRQSLDHLLPIFEKAGFDTQGLLGAGDSAPGPEAGQHS